MAPTYSIRIHTLECFLPDEATDEAYLMYNGQKIWPSGDKYRPMKEGSSEPVKVEISTVKGATISVELWEFDTLSSDDNLGKFLLEADKEGGPYTTDMIKADNGKSKYSLTWEVV